MLTSVLKPTGRYKHSKGKNEDNRENKCSRKYTILDSQESFVLKITTLSDYQRHIDAIIDKYFHDKKTIQPFIVVEGIELNNIKSFAVYFNKILYTANSFLHSIDICFKIFHTLNLQYPAASEFPWLFIQKYFFDIETKYDKKSSNLTEMLNSLNNLSK